MPQIKLQHISTFTSEDKNFPAQNLVDSDSFRKWKSSKGEKNASVTFQLAKAEQIHEIHIGNEGSAFIEVLVGRTAMKEEDFKVLLVASSFMSPVESRNGQNATRVRLFGPDKLSSTLRDEKWDKVKVVCTQPFNRTAQYGLSFFKLHSPPVTSYNSSQAKINELGAFSIKTESPTSDIKAGSLFASRHKDTKTASPLTGTGAAAVRAASKQVETQTQSTSSTHIVTPSSSLHIDTPPSTTLKRKISDSSSSHKVKQRPTTPDSSSSHKVKQRPTTPDSSSSHKVKQRPLTLDSSSSHKVKKRPTTPEATKLKKQTSRRESTSSSDTHTADQLKKAQSEPRTTPANKPFHKIMEKVVFVISGYQNPKRSEIRDDALEMGAKYRPDWGRGCSHLICSYDNTPKYNQVKGKGRIVKAAWIDDCYRKKKLLPWRRYRVGRAKSPPTSSESEAEEEVPPKRTIPPESQTPVKMSATSSAEMSDVYDGSTDVDTSGTDEEEPNAPPAATTSAVLAAGSAAKIAPATCSVYDASTDEELDEEEEASVTMEIDDQLPELPDFFGNKNFFLYGDFSASDKRRLIRFIVAYNGNLEDYMSSTTHYVVTNSRWGAEFDDALTDNPDLTFVRPDWLLICDEKQRRIAHQKFVVVPP